MAVFPAYVMPQACNATLQIEYNEKLASESEAHVKADKEHHDKTPEELQASSPACDLAAFAV